MIPCRRTWGVLRRPYLIASLALLLGGINGCGADSDRYSISGTVTFNGEPVPVGRLVFTPDNKKGNNGPQGVAEIVDGEIKQGDRKSIGGPQWVQIQAFDGKAFQDAEMMIDSGRPLLPMQMVPVDLPRANAEILIAIKETAAGQHTIDIEVEQ